MPLSEYEQRVLEEMEQQLRSDDPKLAKAISSGAPRRPLQVVLGAVVVLAGIGLLFTGLYTQLLVLGIVGFVAMFGGVLVALRRSGSGPSAPSDAPRDNVRPMRRPRGRGFMDRLEERWDRRRDER